jgi:predicted nucleic acid-binding protein
MPDAAVTDSGPVIHLAEVDSLDALQVFVTVTASYHVQAELRRHDAWEAVAEALGSRLRVADISAESLATARGAYQRLALSDADLSVAVLAADARPSVVLTDDLALRSGLVAHGFTAVGSVGVLVRALKTGMFARSRFDHAIDRLLDDSTLYLSRAFRDVVRRLVAELPG